MKKEQEKILEKMYNDMMEIESLCEYAIPGKEYRETYPFPYKCRVMYECVKKKPTKDCSCIRKEIAKNQLIQNGCVGIEKKCQEWKQ